MADKIAIIEQGNLGPFVMCLCTYLLDLFEYLEWSTRNLMCMLVGDSWARKASVPITYAFVSPPIRNEVTECVGRT